MKSLKLAEKRHSVREYKHKKLSNEALQYLSNLLLEKPEISKISSLEFRFIENGFGLAPQLETVSGYFGKMITAPHYYALFSHQDDFSLNMAGYVGEWFILNALKKDIGSCWLEVRDSNQLKQILSIETSKKAVALIAVGYAKKEFQGGEIYAASRSNSLSSLTDLGYPDINPNHTKEPMSSRKSITELAYLNTWGNTPEIRELEMRGLHEALFYMRLAPSYGNRQPWYFVICENHIDLVMDQSDDLSPFIQGIDAGIAMFYFEVGLHDSGIRGSWHMDALKAEYALPGSYKLVGQYRF
ncbi:nitroreductase family protein [Fusibacter sp. 3D3]|uniref:nitroreductase family protein n=1 Tax=Fusibacter sp. 3D3 TaxID=1048380 RepID=UPI000852D3A5|nr:nitroreductase family protein [Fusibacter sp. 3D3]GAU79994.1 Nitroreductase family protein [Fusibacter sp. 3D3]